MLIPATDYDNWSKEELIQHINSMHGSTEVARKKQRKEKVFEWDEYRYATARAVASGVSPPPPPPPRHSAAGDATTSQRAQLSPLLEPAAAAVVADAAADAHKAMAARASATTAAVPSLRLAREQQQQQQQQQLLLPPLEPSGSVSARRADGRARRGGAHHPAVAAVSRRCECVCASACERRKGQGQGARGYRGACGHGRTQSAVCAREVRVL